jgi:hypothetical protein
MTLMIGASMPSAPAAMLIADTRMTIRERDADGPTAPDTHEDDLLKVHQISPRLVAAFSGSAVIALRLIARMQADQAALPVDWAFMRYGYGEDTGRRLRTWYQELCDAETPLVTIAVGGIFGDERVPGAPTGSLIAFSSPTFDPQYPMAGECVTFGTGSMLESAQRFKRAVEQRSTWPTEGEAAENRKRISGMPRVR